MRDTKWTDPRTGREWLVAVRGSWAGAVGVGGEFGPSAASEVEFVSSDGEAYTTPYEFDMPFTSLSQDQKQALLDEATSRMDPE